MLEAFHIFPDLPLVLLIGFVAGVLGGMLGVGGSVIMIPGMTFVLGYNQQLYQAAAMIVNVAVSIPAALRHKRAGAIVPAVLKWMLPAAVVFVIVGVAVSNLPVFSHREGAKWLGRVLAAFLVYVIVLNLRRVMRPEPARTETGGEHPHVTRPRSLGVGSVMGFIAGLLGIGGGALAVPLQQVTMKLPLRRCIANSSAVICISAALGAIYKNITLPLHTYTTIQGDTAHYTITQSLLLAALLAPTAWVGGRIGAGLTHRLPVRQVRVAFILLMIVAAWKMSALPWP